MERRVAATSVEQFDGRLLWPTEHAQLLELGSPAPPAPLLKARPEAGSLTVET